MSASTRAREQTVHTQTARPAAAAAHRRTAPALAAAFAVAAAVLPVPQPVPVLHAALTRTKRPHPCGSCPSQFLQTAGHRHRDDAASGPPDDRSLCDPAGRCTLTPTTNRPASQPTDHPDQTLNNQQLGHQQRRKTRQHATSKKPCGSLPVTADIRAARTIAFVRLVRERGTRHDRQRGTSPAHGCASEDLDVLAVALVGGRVFHYTRDLADQVLRPSGPPQQVEAHLRS